MDLKREVMIASGNFGYDGFGTGQEHYPLNRLGGVVMKTLTTDIIKGNELPFQFPSNFADDTANNIFLNSYGLNNPGIGFASEYLFDMWGKIDTDIIVSIAGRNEQEWIELANKINKFHKSNFIAVELNLSCPNSDSYLLHSYDKDLIYLAVTAIKPRIDLMCWVKLAPNVPNIIELAATAMHAGADALVIANTIPALHIDIDTGKSVLGNIYGGMSGPALKPINMALVHKIGQAIDIPIIGVGGICSGKDAVEYAMAGASAVQVGSANKADFYAPFRISSEYNELRYRNVNV